MRQAQACDSLIHGMRLGRPRNCIQRDRASGSAKLHAAHGVRCCSVGMAWAFLTGLVQGSVLAGFPFGLLVLLIYLCLRCGVCFVNKLRLFP